MIEFDPGPTKALARHLDDMPSYADKRELFWYDWGPIFYRGRLERLGPAAGDRLRSRARRSESRAARWWATPGSGCRGSCRSWA